MQCGPIRSFTVYVVAQISQSIAFFFSVASLTTIHLLSLYYLISASFPPLTGILFSPFSFYLLFIPLPFLSSTRSTLACPTAYYCSYPARNLVPVWPLLLYKCILPFFIFVLFLVKLFQLSAMATEINAPCLWLAFKPSSTFAVHSITAPHCRWERLTMFSIVFLPSPPLICFLFLFYNFFLIPCQVFSWNFCSSACLRVPIQYQDLESLPFHLRKYLSFIPSH